MKTLGIILGALFFCALIPACTAISSYNAFQRRDEAVGQAWAQVLSVYQKRADLVPNLVETTKGYATHEADVLTKVATARASAGKVQLPEGTTPEDMKKFADAQRELSGALGRLFAVAESNPTLQASRNFMALQVQLAAIETQATAARNRYTREVQAYNTNIRSFPSNMVAGFFGYKVKPQLEFEDVPSLKKSPRVNFKS